MAGVQPIEIGHVPQPHRVTSTIVIWFALGLGLGLELGLELGLGLRLGLGLGLRVKG